MKYKKPKNGPTDTLPPPSPLPSQNPSAVSPPLYGQYATAAVGGMTIGLGGLTSVPFPNVKYSQPREQTSDFRIGRREDGVWLLGRHEFETQEELLAALQDSLDELYGADDDMLGTGIFGPRSFP